MRPAISIYLTIVTLALQSACCLGAAIDPKMHHLRSGAELEWDEFADTPEGKELVLKFSATRNDAEQTLRLRQRDVKQAWNIRLNDKKLAMLLQDEKDTVVFFKLPPGALNDGQNELKISCDAGPALASDDILLGDIRLIPTPLNESLSQSTLNLHVTESDKPIPSRITIVDENNSLISLAT